MQNPSKNALVRSVVPTVQRNNSPVGVGGCGGAPMVNAMWPSVVPGADVCAVQGPPSCYNGAFIANGVPVIIRECNRIFTVTVTTDTGADEEVTVTFSPPNGIFYPAAVRWVGTGSIINELLVGTSTVISSATPGEIFTTDDCWCPVAWSCINSNNQLSITLDNGTAGTHYLIMIGTLDTLAPGTCAQAISALVPCFEAVEGAGVLPNPPAAWR